jgi:3-isopropylmalate/(R)-2-methylmalate dehydratase small subunit
MQAFTNLNSQLVPLPYNNVDTDQIIPARFLKVTDKAGLTKGLFDRWRYLPDGRPNPDFALNWSECQGAQILLAGDNFGCGSSREHAPWALLGYGFRAVISTSFADIFRNNALKNGLLPVVVRPDFHHLLFQLVEQDPHIRVTVDLNAQAVKLADGQVEKFPIDPFSKYCLLQGTDQLGYLLQQEAHITAFERSRGY